MANGLQQAHQDYEDARTAAAIGITIEQVKTLNRWENWALEDIHDFFVKIEPHPAGGNTVTFWAGGFHYQVAPDGGILDIRC